MTKAKVGDYILITNRDANETRYENGAVFEVPPRQNHSIGVFVRTDQPRRRMFIYEEEYEVVPEYAPGSFIRVKVSGNVYEVGRRVDGKQVLTTQGALFHVKDVEPYVHGPYAVVPQAVEAQGISGGCTLSGDQLAAHSITAEKLAGNIFTNSPEHVQTLTPWGSGQTTTLRHDLPKDNVNQPNHYTQGKYEVIDMIAELVRGYEKLPYVAYCLGNVIKYIARAPFKHESPLEDLRKARRYLDYAIKHAEESEGNE